MILHSYHHSCLNMPGRDFQLEHCFRFRPLGLLVEIISVLHKLMKT